MDGVHNDWEHTRNMVDAPILSSRITMTVHEIVCNFTCFLHQNIGCTQKLCILIQWQGNQHRENERFSDSRPIDSQLPYLRRQFERKHTKKRIEQYIRQVWNDSRYNGEPKFRLYPVRQ